MTGTKQEKPFDLNERQKRILALLNERNSLSAASVAYALRLAGGESAALTELRQMSEHGIVESFSMRGSLMWRAKSAP